MMKSPRNLLIFAVLGGVVGLILGILLGRVAYASSVNSDSSNSSEQIMSVLMAQQDAWNAGDIEGFMQGYRKNSQLRFASGGDITTGWSETLSRYQARYSDRAKMGTLRFDIKTVDVLDEDDGLVFGKWTLIRDADRPNGLFTLHMKKDADGWKVVSDHTSSADY